MRERDKIFYSFKPSVLSPNILRTCRSPVSVAQHTYICQSLSTEIRVRTSDRTQPGPISCSADVMPFDFTFDFLPHQLLQYQQLKSQMLSQQRFDTMQRQRPSQRPIDNPRVWWLYAISCVMSRPNSRPWKDILPIVKNRERYIELVLKKNTKNSRLLGYHTGLSSSESEELLKIEDLLPIEVLMAFHTVAMRKAYNSQRKQDAIIESQHSLPPKDLEVKPKSQRPALFRLPRIGGGSNNKKSRTEKEIHDNSPPNNNSDVIVSPFTDSKTRSFTLLDSMTLRLGRKVWYVDWNLHDAVINLHLRKNTESEPIVRFSLRADGRARSFGLGKRDFLFDLSQFDILHRDDKILFINPVDDESFIEEEMDDVPAKSSKNVVSRNGPDMKMPSTFLDLPPSGSVCRVVAGKNIDAVMLSVSAHPATLVCGTSLLKGISDFVSAQSSETDYDLALHVRSAATPLARKAQLALLSPAAMSLHLNIAAPKAWVALVSNDKRGTLFIDAGTIRVASIKSKGETDADWDFHAIDMGVTLVRGVDPMTIGNEGNSYFRTYGVPFPPIGRVETSIIRPLSIDAKSRLQNSSIRNEDKQSIKSTVSGRDSVRKTEISVSPICLNLVDAEILARTVGKWYAIILGRVRRRVQSRDEKNDPLNRQGASHQDSSELHVLQRYGAPRVVSLKIQKLEMALEGRSKNASSVTNDDTSFISLDTLLEHAPPSRAYLVEVFEVGLTKTTTQIADTTTLTIGDATIVRLKDSASYLPLKARRDQITSENWVLSRESTDHVHRRNIFRATHFRNRAFYIDEVEVDIDSVGVRLTPTTLKDCAKALKRIAELAQLVTKEMERKVHEEGRKARKERRGKSLLVLFCVDE
jgi:Vacuolar sorting-associated protein 13, N-terminal